MRKYFLTILFLLTAALAFTQKRTVITGTVNDTSVKSVRITLFEAIHIREETDTLIYLENGRFAIAFPLNEPGYFHWRAGKNELPNRLLEPGDSLHIEVDAKGKYSFTGKGYEKMVYQQEAHKKFAGWQDVPERSSTARYHELYFRYLDDRKKEQQAFLAQYKNRLSSAAFKILSLDIWSEAELLKFNRIFLLRKWPGKQKESEMLYAAWIFTNRWEIAQDDTAAWSGSFINFIVQRAELDYTMLWNMYGGKWNFYDKYNMVQSLTEGKVEERALAALLRSRLRTVADRSAELSVNDYLNGNAADELKAAVEHVYQQQKRFGMGLPAKDFVLPDVQDTKVSLAQFRGKIVLLDFWFANCPGCIHLFTAMQKVKERFKENVVFVNISVDAKKDEWIKAIQRFHLNDAINVYTEGKGESHPVVKDYGVKGYPKQFLVDKRGKFIASNIPRADYDNGEGVIRLIEDALKKGL